MFLTTFDSYARQIGLGF